MWYTSQKVLVSLSIKSKVMLASIFFSAHSNRFLLIGKFRVSSFLTHWKAFLTLGKCSLIDSSRASCTGGLSHKLIRESINEQSETYTRIRLSGTLIDVPRKTTHITLDKANAKQSGRKVHMELDRCIWTAYLENKYSWLCCITMIRPQVYWTNSFTKLLSSDNYNDYR